MLFMHEVHKVRGRAEDEFEAAFRDGWMPDLGNGDDARLLWYANHAHGSGPAYTVVTVTAVRDGAAWERLARRIQAGDLRQWMRDLDVLRHDVDAKLLMALPWSPLGDMRLDEIPTDGREHELTLYMEDTMWPFENMFTEYIDHPGRVSAGAGQPPAPRSGADAAHPAARGLAEFASHRNPVGLSRTGHLDVRGIRSARSVDQPATPDLVVVTAVLRRG
jgi:hypothetical protein